jgi:hypothetical protein
MGEASGLLLAETVLPHQCECAQAWEIAWIWR